MASASIAAITMMLMVPALSAQPERQIAFTVTVSDPSGARLPGANVQVRCGGSTKVLTQSTADAAGMAVVTVDPGDCTVSVQATGFMSWQYKMDSRREPGRSLKAVLRVGMLGSGPVISDEQQMETACQTVDASIPYEELELLTNLPSRTLRFRRRHGII